MHSSDHSKIRRLYHYLEGIPTHFAVVNLSSKFYPLFTHFRDFCLLRNSRLPEVEPYLCESKQFTPP